jgi:hypothetical protein
LFEKVMQVHRIIDAPVARLGQTRLALAATLVITGSLFFALFIRPTPAFADTLVVGSVYFDSEQTLDEVINLSSQHDNEGIAQLIKDGHISDRTQEEQEIVVLVSPSTPESPTEFRFLNGPTTFWTLAKNVTSFAKPIPIPTPLPTATPESTPLPLPTETPSSKQHNQQNESNARFRDDSSKRVWHQVDDKWKRHSANTRHLTGWHANTMLNAANPRVSPGPVNTLPAPGSQPSPTPLIMNEGTNLYNSDRTQPFKSSKPPGQ